MRALVAFAAAFLLLMAGCPQELVEEREDGGNGQQAPSAPPYQPPSGDADGNGNGNGDGETPLEEEEQQIEDCLEYSNYVIGKLHGVQGTYFNKCDGSSLEYYSCKYGEVEKKTQRCGWGCGGGACVHNTDNALCVSSSESNDPYSRGISKMVIGTTVMEEVEDRCASPDELWEYSCYYGDIRKEAVKCACREGECVG